MNSLIEKDENNNKKPNESKPRKMYKKRFIKWIGSPLRKGVGEVLRGMLRGLGKILSHFLNL